LLERLAGYEHVALGLGTGNVERGAQIKLGRARLGRHFSFGGYGSDSAERAELLRAGAERGAARLGVSVVTCRVVVIGDTPRDVAGAQAIGADCLAVGTGGHEAAALQALGATCGVANLAESAAFEFILG
jgi:phosphoglycolate phosphatase-like HAD superfamily hydrolase